MKKLLCILLSILLLITLITGCNSSKSKNDDNPIVFVWYPNASTRDLEEARNELGKIVEQATGKKVKHLLTTDYTILIESLINNKADLCLAGAQTYIESSNKNEGIQPMVIPSGPSGTLKDALYYSWVAVANEDAKGYKEGDKFSLNNIPRKKISFVSSSSTSGFKIASQNILSHFKSTEKYKSLRQEDLLESDNDSFFEEVIFSGSHQLSAVNLLTDKVDIAVFADIIFNNYGTLISGEANSPGAIYKVKKDASEPFNTLAEKTFTLIASIPVPNDLIIMNTNTISQSDQQKIIKAFTSENVANNPKIFMPSDCSKSGFLTKTANEKFLPVDASWFDQIQKLK